MTDRRAQIWVDLAIFVLLAVAVSLTFGRAVSVPFFYDDYPAIVENESLRKLWPPAVPLRAPQDTPFSARPLVNLSAAVNYHFGQLKPSGYRLFSLGIHSASAMLLFLIARRALVLWRPSNSSFSVHGLALAIALVGAVHPLQTESVCYATQRTELMMGLAYLGTLYASLRYWAADNPAARSSWLALATAACLAGMASKEVMVSAPLVVLLFDRAFVSRSFAKALRNSRTLYIALALTWGLLAFLAADSPRSSSAGFHLNLSPLTWWLTQCKVVLLYLRLAFWPWPLSIHYEIPYLTNFRQAWPSVAVVSLLIAGVVVALRRNWPSGFLGAWFFLILSPTLLVPIPTEVAAERRMYLPLAAVVALVIGSAYRFVATFSRSANRLISPAVPTLVVALPTAIGLAAISHHRLAAYHDPVTLWRDTLAQYPNSELAHANLGFALMRAGNDGEALEHLQEAVNLNPAADDAHYRLGLLYKNEGRIAEAAKHYGAAARLRPSHAGYHNDYGSALLKVRQFAAAAEQFNQALVIDPDMRVARYNLALSYALMGQTRDAIAEYEYMLERAPDDVEVHIALAKVLLVEKQTQPAIDHLNRALELAQRDKQEKMVSTIEELLSSFGGNDLHKSLERPKADQ